MGRPAYLSRHRIDLAAAGLLTLALFAASWYRHATYRSYAYDLGVYQQVLWKMAHGHGATSTLTGWNTFGDHFSPILLAFVPLYWIASTPVWLFAAQSIALGAGALCVRPLAVAAGLDKDSVLPKLLLAAYVLSPALWNAGLYDFHQTTVAVPVLMIGCIAALRHKHAHLWLVLLALVILRDDLAIAAIPLGLIGWRSDDKAGHRQRLALIGVAMLVTVVGAQIGTALGASRHFDARYGYLGSSMTNIALHPAHALVGVASHLFATNNILPIAALLLPLAFLPLRKPAWFGIALIMMLPTLLASDVNFHSPAFHYGAPIAPFVFLAAAGALTKPIRHPRAGAVGISLGIVGFVFIGPVTTGALTSPTINPADARAAMATIKPTDGVASGNDLAAHLAGRDVLKPFPLPMLAADPTFPLDPKVLDHSAKAQSEIDVVVVAADSVNGVNKSMAKLLKTEAFQEQFVEEDFGTVRLFRRVAPVSE